MDFIFITVHKGYVAFRCADGRTGSNPGTLAENISYFITILTPGVENVQIRYET